jgi:hypothetical protein
LKGKKAKPSPHKQRGLHPSVRQKRTADLSLS